jgi:hypothetical protein
MNLSQFKPFKYDDSYLQPNIRERNPVLKRDPAVFKRTVQIKMQ